MTVPLVNLESYDLLQMEMKAEHLDGLHALSASIGWPHRKSDWGVNLAAGNGIVAVDESGRVHGSAMYFTLGGDVSAVGMVIAHPRLKLEGLATCLMANIVERTEDRPAFLNACNDSVPFYRSLGALVTGPVFQHQGIVGPISASKTRTRPAEATDLPQIFDCDADAHGVDRSALLLELWRVSETMVIERRGRIRGFAMRRQFGRGHLIGPIIAEKEVDAVALVEAFLTGLPGSFVRVDTRVEYGLFRQYLEKSGLLPVMNVVTMTLGRLPSRGSNAVFGLSSHSTG
ncbi:GNAT family N-acetyltransferase [Rhizobium cremeum]|uniref:GNAT family N-acetyltransferase n=1 Tax=Rhizobium cremeum TaxID=2813827 RepID=UPI000DD84664|nr:GNAT family N-acetyltransferase [Rhizobium cremeum]MCJ7997006.1 GNAT family N-acetyltransferase [Rhizobium cremeum]MCJ8002224.1 GNAT family N-acetyltransferase [Rhizobium cremeum]